MALTQEDLQAIGALMDSKLEPITERLDRLEGGQTALAEAVSRIDESVVKLEAMPHQLGLVADKVAMNSEKLDELTGIKHTVEDQGDRIFALEQAAANG